ncbi:hypothetical protein TNCV_3385391 [Trichonephila clavipes]|uniref:Uncharacterized protein n=1 Tax=Trichonephila clavipes TaxID=2585209 RepID=A0A8X6T3W3_TRICX|nr:hypothetical protein TNCV_3385391 [Trichonephila clavipes]
MGGGTPCPPNGGQTPILQFIQLFILIAQVIINLLALTVSETLFSGVLPMEWEPTEVHTEEMEWKYSFEGPEPMDWEDSPEVETIIPAPKKVSSPLESNINVSLQEKENFPNPIKVSPTLTEIVRRKVRSRPKVSTPEVSFENRVILKAR